MRTLLAAAALGAALGWWPAAALARGGPAPPEPAADISAPLPMDAAAGPIFTGDRDVGEDASLKAAGYAQQEYFVSGTVNGQPYRNTILVRRPIDPRRFSGLVVVEPVHVDGDSVLWQYEDVILGGGDGFVLVGAQRASLERTIIPLNPARYKDLRIPAAPVDAAKPPLAGVLAGAPAALAGMLQAVEIEAPIAHEVMNQVGAMLKANRPDGPFAGEPVRWLITGGVSQTGQLTLTYLRGPAAKATVAGGGPVFDGFFATESAGDGPVPPHAGKVIQALGEADYLNFARASRAAYRRPDSDAPGDRYRLYEVAGASHVTTREADLDPGARKQLAATYTPDEHPSQFPSRLIYATALQTLIDWVEADRPPPRAARLELTPDGDVARDRWGNARGGVRLSTLDVPIARYIAATPPNGPGGFNRRFFGTEVPFSEATLAQLYSTHADYVAKVRASLAGLTAAGWIEPAYAAELEAEAEKARVP